MKVCMKVQISGYRGDERWPAIGGEVVVSDREGAELCALGYADPVAEPAKAQTRVVEPKRKARG